MTSLVHGGGCVGCGCVGGSSGDVARGVVEVAVAMAVAVGGRGSGSNYSGGDMFYMYLDFFFKKDLHLTNIMFGDMIHTYF